ncbi:MAG: helix-turn-helix domain-containing protein [Spirochaetaceae bacterium]|jgi:transcriptional regulator with XRE-family HTH domain|nr:helix-turn-helix domain-containing protein [Spirochaetaceae bacterium]
MTDLRQLLAVNLKRFRGELGLSQAKLAEKANTSTHHVAMIELTRQFPSPEMLGKLAFALEVDTLELFSMPPAPARALKKLHTAVLLDLREAVETAVSQVVDRHIEALEE